MAYNVPAVYDVFAARIRALRSKDQGCKNVAEVLRGSEAAGRPTQQNRSPSRLLAAKRKQSCYAQLVFAFIFSFFHKILL
jgi:hypothetical protein